MQHSLQKVRQARYDITIIKGLDFDHFGKNEMKKWRVSPDASIQMAYQLAQTFSTRLASAVPTAGSALL